MKLQKCDCETFRHGNYRPLFNNCGHWLHVLPPYREEKESGSNCDLLISSVKSRSWTFSQHLTFFPDLCFHWGTALCYHQGPSSPSSVAFPNLFLILLILPPLNSILITSLAFTFFSLPENYNQITQYIDRPSDS